MPRHTQFSVSSIFNFDFTLAGCYLATGGVPGLASLMEGSMFTIKILLCFWDWVVVWTLDQYVYVLFIHIINKRPSYLFATFTKV